MYEMEGASPGRITLGQPVARPSRVPHQAAGCPASRYWAKSVSCLSSPALRTARQCRVPVRDTSFPIPPASPKLPPGGTRFQR